MSALSRGWLGFAARWTGPGNAAALNALSPTVQPVIVVGQDACDDGGIVGCSLAEAVPAASFAQLALGGSSRGFTLWTLLVRVGAAGAQTLWLSLQASAPGAAAPVALATFGNLRNVLAQGSVEPGPVPVTFRVPIDGASAVSVVNWARPIVVPPNAWLVVRTNVSPGVAEIGAFFEEGL